MNDNKPLTHKVISITSNESNQKVDVRGGVPVLEYRESVLCPYIIIDLSIIDTGTSTSASQTTPNTLGGGGRGTVGILESIKLQGTEKFDLKLEDQYGNQIDLTNDELRVAKTIFASIGTRTSSCSVRVVSKEAYDNCLYKNRMRDIYNGTGDSIIRAALKNLGTNKDLFADTTEETIYKQGEGKYPFEMCLDVQKVSIPEGIDSAGFLFWETSRGYNFRSLDKMFEKTGKRIKKYVETGFADGKVYPGFNGKILKSSFNKMTDMLNQFEEGAYNSRLELFDILSDKKRYAERTRTTPSDGRGVIAGVNIPILEKQYRDEPTAEIRRTNDDGQKVDPAKSLTDTILETSFNVVSTAQQSIQNYRQKFNSSLNIVIDADLSLSAGDLVECKFPETAQKPSPRSSTQYSGIYMIADLCHYSTPTQAFTGLNLVRDSYGVKT